MLTWATAPESPPQRLTAQPLLGPQTPASPPQHTHRLPGLGCLTSLQLGASTWTRAVSD